MILTATEEDSTTLLLRNTTAYETVTEHTTHCQIERISFTCVSKLLSLLNQHLNHTAEVSQLIDTQGRSALTMDI